MGAATPSLLHLPDDVICVLLRYLDATSLYLLGRTCSHLDDLIRNYFTLWKRIDARRSPNDQAKVSYCLDRCYNNDDSWTHSLFIGGDNQEDSLIPSDFFCRINDLTRLTVLALENQALDGTKINAKSFPNGLIELSLKQTKITESQEFFKGSGDYFQHLKVLILDDCDWLLSCAFMPISKYPKLQILSVYKCQNLEDSIAYLSLAGLKFEELKIFDARLSSLGNTLIRSIYKAPSLLAMYFQNSDLSYKLDYLKRKLEIQKGSPVKNSIKIIDEFTEDEENGVNNVESTFLDDKGLVEYISVGSSEKSEVMPTSVLYTDPYNKCTCNFDNRQFISMNPPDSPSNNDDDDPNNALKTKINELSDLIFRNNHRLNNHNHREPVATVILRDNADNIIVKVIDLQQNEDEPPAKRLRTDDNPGPSGLNVNGSDSESDEEVILQPDRNVGEVFAEGLYRYGAVRFYLRNSPVVTINHVYEMQKNLKVPLKRLSLRGYKKITDIALRYIKDLDLDLLDLTYTNVSIEAIENYLKSHPLCRVVHPKFCICPINLHF